MATRTAHSSRSPSWPGRVLRLVLVLLPALTGGWGCQPARETARQDDDLRHVVDPGAGHDPRLWGERLPQMLPFLYPASEELGLPLGLADSAEGT